MFAKLKKKLAEEAAAASPRSGVRIPRTLSRESMTSGGADSGDDFASDGSSSRDDLPAQLLRRNDQIRKLEAKLSEYAEQLRIMQKTKEKLEIALETHQDSSIKKLQDQMESHQVGRAKMAEGLALALEQKDQEWTEKLALVEKEKTELSGKLQSMIEQSVSLFQKRDDLDELEGFQNQELAKVKHLLLRREEQLSKRERELRILEEQQEESSRLNTELEIEREELLLLRQEADRKVSDLEKRSLELQSLLQQVSQDFQQSQSLVSSLEKSLGTLQTEHDALKLQQKKMALTEEEKDRLLAELQRKVTLLERRLQGNMSEDEHLQEILQEKQSLEKSLEEMRAALLDLRTNHADALSTQELQVTNLKQQMVESSERLKGAEQQITEKQQHMVKLQSVWSAEKVLLEQQLRSLEQQREETVSRLQKSITSLESENRTLQDTVLELNTQQTLNTELTTALDESRRQEEELQKQVVDQTSVLQSLQQQLNSVSQSLTLRERDVLTLNTEVQSGQASQERLQEEVERLQVALQQTEQDRDSELNALKKEVQSRTEQRDSCQARMLYLEVELETLTEQLRSRALPEHDQNGIDLHHVQTANRELEQQLNDKNKTIKQLQQRLTELKRTLQKELKLKPEPEADVKEKPTESRAEKPERNSPDPAPPTAAVLHLSPPTSNSTVSNNSDHADGPEINFEYLKHVVLKFMSSREAEAYQLIRAVSVLLHFTREEEDMLKETLQYKMSWFGSKPSPKGIVRPTISGSSSLWR